MLRKMAAVTLIGATAFAVSPAVAAFADGPDTPPSVSRHINAQSWPTLQRGDQGSLVKTVQYLLRGYHLTPSGVSANYDIPTNGVFDANLEKVVKSFQGWRGLSTSGQVGTATWNSFQSDFAKNPIGPGAKNSAHVSAVQVLLIKHGYDVDVDGQYGQATTDAVKRYQDAKNIGVDGITGEDTFKALVAG